MERPYLIISDLHGDDNSLEMVREKEKKYNALSVISSGDLCRDEYNPLYNGIISCSGNCDRYSDSFPDYISLDIFSHKTYITHGDIYNKNSFPLSLGDIFVSGHTHIPKLYKEDGIYFLNPGSTSCPRSHLGPTYALIFPSCIKILSLLDDETLYSLSFF